MGAEELELAVGVRGHKLVQHQPAEQFRQHEHGQEELRFAPDPFFSVSRQPAARYDHVHVRMMRHRYAPRKITNRAAVSGGIWDNEHLRLATDAARVALWSWNVDTDR